ncbi:MAG: hypothetical protein Q4G71_12190 [Pseudomonadota bacterium]|nr:hypothetical protein [Pseudomonadota bacterium]
MTTPAAPAADIHWRALAWLMLPPLLVLLLRAALQGMQGDGGGWQALRPAALVDSPAQALWVASRPFVFTLLGAGGAALALFYGGRAVVRRHGWARVRPLAQALWLALWALLAAWLVASHLNRAGRTALPAQTATVLLAGQVAPSARGPGGTELYVELPGEAAPLRLFAEGQPAQAFAPRSAVLLHVQQGRWWGRWARAQPAGGPAGAGG